MKSTITLTLSLLFSTSALAQTGTEAGLQDASATTTIDATKAGVVVSASLDSVQTKVLAGETSPEAFDGIKASILQMGTGMSQTSPMAGERLQRRVADLELRAKGGSATAEDFAILREQVVDARLDHAITQLATAAKAPSMSSASFAQVSELLQARAAATAELDPQAADGNQAVIRVVYQMQKKSGTSILEDTDFALLRSSLAETRLDRAMVDLQQRAVMRVASPTDYARVGDVLTDRTKVIGTSAAKELQVSLSDALTKLKAKADAGGVTAADFTALQDGMVAKARDAAALKTE
ncbi:MAG: hypothetical protein ACI8QZ_004171 [Chlamydiales bacterium]|jgi:hypothetical protein